MYGIPGQIVAAVASAAGVLLVWTGFAMAWRRFFPKNSRKKKQFGPADAFEV